MGEPTSDSMRATAHVLAIAEGCDCTPAITIDEIRPGVFNTRIAHDAHCRLLLRRARGGN